MAHPARTLRFARKSAFHQDLCRRVDAWLAEPGRSAKDAPAMYGKTLTILGWFGTSWAWLVLGSPPAWLAVLLAISIGLSVAAVGMCIQHDANHGGYSRHPWVNRALGWSLDAAGASSFVWKTKHNTLHHAFTNVSGHDDDVSIGALGRWTPDQPRRALHRFQHIYTWALYGFLLPKWVFFDDFRNLLTRRVGAHALPRPSVREWVELILGKIVFVAWSLALPMIWHPVGHVLVGFFLMCFTVGVTLSVTFQLAHCVEEADFPPPPADGRVPTDWAEHQLQTTVDFATHSRLLTWFMGGLNFQVEHHLFPRVCHLHYPAIATIVTKTAEDHGLRRKSTRTFRAAIASHYRLLRRLGTDLEPKMA